MSLLAGLLCGGLTQGASDDMAFGKTGHIFIWNYTYHRDNGRTETLQHYEYYEKKSTNWMLRFAHSFYNEHN